MLWPAAAVAKGQGHNIAFKLHIADFSGRGCGQAVHQFYRRLTACQHSLQAAAAPSLTTVFIVMVATQLLLRVLYTWVGHGAVTHTMLLSVFAQAPGALAGQVLFNICTGCLLRCHIHLLDNTRFSYAGLAGIAKGFVQARRAWDGFAGRYISCSRADRVILGSAGGELFDIGLAF